jgi:hypothetical protein
VTAMDITLHAGLFPVAVTDPDGNALGLLQNR